MRQTCAELDVLFCRFDEARSPALPGRTGPLFSPSDDDVVPDLMTTPRVSPPLRADGQVVFLSQTVYDTIADGGQAAVGHGFTYSARHPLAWRS